MAGFRRTIHPVANFVWGRTADLFPDLQLQSSPLANGSGGEPVDAMALAFTDPQDGETHIYVFAEEGRKKLIAALTGGIVVPGS